MTPDFSQGVPPPILTPVFENIPSELRALPQWLVWKADWNAEKQKWNKPPYNAKTGKLGKSNDPATWATFDQARSAYTRGKGAFAGVGFAPSESDPYTGIDLDKCIDAEGNIAAWANRWIDLLDSYTEVSPSGTGIRIFTHARMPATGGKRGDIEMYRTTHYLTMTGRRVSGTPAKIQQRQAQVEEMFAEVFPAPPPRPPRPASPESLNLTDQEVLDKATKATNGGDIRALFHGDISAYPSMSEAESALCWHLAFYTQDAAQIDRIVRTSALLRDKWDSVNHSDGSTHGETTIRRAIEGVTARYGDKIGDSVNSVNSVNTYKNSITHSDNHNNNNKNDSVTDSEAPEPISDTIDRIDRIDTNTPAASSSVTEDWETPLSLGTYELPSFPIHAFPLWLGEYVESLAVATQTPDDLAGMVALCSCAAALQKRAEVQVRSGWKEPLNLYGVCVLGPGNRKTAVVSALTQPMKEWEAVEQDKQGPEIELSASARRILLQKQKKAEGRAAEASGSDLHVEMANLQDIARDMANLKDTGEYRLFMEDCTPEMLPNLLATNNGRMAVLSAEGDAFDIISGRYSDKANLGVYLKSHSGEPLIVDRVGRKGARVDRPALTIGMAIQPDVIRGLMAKPQLRGRGLLARFLYSLPQDRMGFRDPNPPPVPDYVTVRYAQGMEALLKLLPDVSEEAPPVLLSLSEDAAAMLLEYMTGVELQLRVGNDMGEIRDWGGKLAGAVARIAALLHLASHALPAISVTTEIPPRVMGSAIEIGRYLTSHARAAFAEMGADKEMDDARHVLEWVKRRGLPEFTQRDLHRAMPGRFKEPKDTLAALLILQGRSYLKEAPAAPKSGAGRPSSPLLLVNPAVFVNSVDSVNGSEGVEI